MTTQPYSTQTISPILLEEITNALHTVGAYGSVEIIVQNRIVTQVTIRNIKKTNVSIQKNHTTEPMDNASSQGHLHGHVHVQIRQR